MAVSSSLPSEVISESTFICDCDEWLRPVCAGEPFYKEHEGKRYCVLHFPGKEKSADFNEALKRKLDAEDFNFGGVWFPDDLNFNNFTFRAQTYFNKATFSAEASFGSATFNAWTSFAGATFNTQVSFSGATFNAEASFGSATFSGDAFFHEAKFSRRANFEAATFSGRAGFYAAVFNSGATFTVAKFKVVADFYASTFIGGVGFVSVDFKASALFGSAVFAEGAIFSATFHDFTDFDGATFSGRASFGGATFNGRASFRGATFNAGAKVNALEAFLSAAASSMAANRSSANFNAGARFVTPPLTPGASFDSTTFNAGVSFREAIFNTFANFDLATFNAETTFSAATFKTGVTFEAATFRDYVRFAGGKEGKGFSDHSSLNLQFSRIEKPDHISFHTLALCPHWFVNADAREFDFTNVEWRGGLKQRHIKQEIENLKKKEISPPHRLLATTCRQLAVNAEENHRYEEASKFRYWAMDARRRESRFGFAPWKLGWWYWAASGYGEKVLRASLVLLGVWLLFAWLYTQPNTSRLTVQPNIGFAHQPRNGNEAAKSPDETIEPLEFMDALTYSAGVMTLQKPEPRPATRLARGLVLLETILGPLQAALLALAIRRKFMR